MIEVRQAVREAVQALDSEGVESPRLEAELLLAHAVGRNRAWVLAHPERRLTPKEVTRFRDLAARRARREPLAYIVGHREFFGLDLAVDPRVLIPRPETELLVERALALARRLPEPVLIADVGAGSGAISVALAVHLPAATIYALDESPDPLAVSAENARRHGVEGRVQCLLGDLLAPLPEAVHLVTANLPYVATEEWEALAPEIREHEPRAALDGGPGGLEVIRRLLATAGCHLRPGGAILLEIGAHQGPAARALAGEYFPQARIDLLQDYARLDRLVVLQMPT
jgi:release factor glutamine methyltransferase